MNEALYDVVIYETATNLIESIVGRDLRLNEGFYNAEKRAETAWSRVNDRYAVAIVAAGAYSEGDTLIHPVAP